MGNKQGVLNQGSPQTQSFISSQSRKKLMRLQKQKMKDKQQRIKSILLEEAKVIERPFRINGKSPLDDSMAYIRETLDKLNFEWAGELLLSFNKEIEKFLRFQVLQWTIEVKQVEETSKLQITSDASMEYYNLSTQIIDNPIQEEQNEDGSMVMKTSEEGGYKQFQQQDTQIIVTSLDDPPNFLQLDSPTGADFKNRSNLFTMQSRSNLNMTETINKRYAQSPTGTMKTVIDKNKLTEVIQDKLPTKLFHAKYDLIVKHIKNKDHPLKILHKLFSKELQKFYEKQRELIFQTNYNEKVECYQNNCKPKESVPHFGVRETSNSSINYNDIESEECDKCTKKERKELFKTICESVKSFRILYKRALLKFYDIDINNLKQSSKNQLDSQILWIILGKRVSNTLFQTSQLAFDEEIDTFKQALRKMKEQQISFFNVDPQFELDEESYGDYLNMQSPLKVDIGNTDDLAVAFRIERLETMDKDTSISRSNLLLRGEEALNQKQPLTPTNQVNIFSSAKNRQKGNESSKNGKNLLGQMSRVMSPDQTQNNKKFKLNACPKPYPKSAKVLKVIQNIVYLQKKKDVFHFVWNKVQGEVFEYWKNKDIKHTKLIINEDNRLSIICYVIVQSQCVDLYATIQALIPFINSKIYEEAAPITTFENAINAVIQDFEEQFMETGSESKGFYNDYVKNQLGGNSGGRAPSFQSMISKRSNAVFSHRETHKVKMIQIRETTKQIINNIDNSEDLKKEEEFLQKRMKTEAGGLANSKRMFVQEEESSEEISQQSQSFIDPDIYNRSFDQSNIKTNLTKNNDGRARKGSDISGNYLKPFNKNMNLKQKLGYNSGKFQNNLAKMSKKDKLAASHLQIDPSKPQDIEVEDLRLSTPYKNAKSQMKNRKDT